MKPIHRAAFLAYARGDLHRRRVDLAEETTRCFLNACERPCVAVSFGKDSLAMLHLARLYRPDVLCIHCDRGEGGDTADILALKARLVEDWGLNLVTAKTEISALEAFQAGIDIKSYLIRAMKAAQDAHGVDGVALGLTFDESGTRRRAIFGRGTLWRMADGTLRAYPVGRWSARDVWACLVANDIPYPPVYDALAEAGIHYDSKMSRTSNMIGMNRVEDGRLHYMQMCDASTRAFFSTLPDDLKGELLL